MILYKNFGDDLLQDKKDPLKDDFFILLKEIGYIGVDKNLDEDAMRSLRLFAIRTYSLAEDTKGTLCIDYESKIPQLNASINYPELKCVGFKGDNLKTLIGILEMSTNVIVCPPEAEDEDVMLIFEHDML